ncbi:hypothetical protein C1I98_13345 [Spongiactinospora gelatinilytica]|uniref:Uncharacterized protein n=1 Tax=Spongiactinospora gelatinilytica TaxID=2666298 RepID=A0A2W2GFU1_9ACTN|nr:hypothetical protein [Spongiactinospora gelatinilytica]PZG47451.1 hypothetical protein C1I98_13345 [Spongiactinospora gelatinilytica]
MNLDRRIELWTVEDAARELHPEMTVQQIRALITIAGLKPVGKKPPGPYGGRPAAVYDGEQLRHAHAVIAPLLIAA